jgi:hypothetical protein
MNSQTCIRSVYHIYLSKSVPPPSYQESDGVQIGSSSYQSRLVHISNLLLMLNVHVLTYTYYHYPLYLLGH